MFFIAASSAAGKFVVFDHLFISPSVLKSCKISYIRKEIPMVQTNLAILPLYRNCFAALLTKNSAPLCLAQRFIYKYVFWFPGQICNVFVYSRGE